MYFPHDSAKNETPCRRNMGRPILCNGNVISFHKMSMIFGVALAMGDGPL